LLCAGNKTVLVLDMGGGTTDVTISEVKDSPRGKGEKNCGVVVSVMASAGHGQVNGAERHILVSILIVSSLSPRMCVCVCIRIYVYLCMYMCM
jgi:molecular chaperone DnaK (HSP70)